MLAACWVGCVLGCPYEVCPAAGANVALGVEVESSAVLEVPPSRSNEAVLAGQLTALGLTVLVALLGLAYRFRPPPACTRVGNFHPVDTYDAVAVLLFGFQIVDLYVAWLVRGVHDAPRVARSPTSTFRGACSSPWRRWATRTP